MTDKKKSPEKPIEQTKPQKCGVVMPVSSIDGCSESHWADVRSILNKAIGDAGFDANLVSNADDIGIIQKRIIQNLYDNPIIVCDVSAKNPNVMFELGLRLAFDKPTIIVKDDKTTYSFDTSPIEHLEYPRDLRFNQIVDFKAELTKKIKATCEAAASDPHHSTFLKHFGKFTVAKLDSKEVSANELILNEIRELRSVISMTTRVRHNPSQLNRKLRAKISLSIRTAVKFISLAHRADIRKAKDEISDFVVNDIDAQEIFEDSSQYKVFFDDVFDSMYDN